jgi:hypothetical protein
MQPTRLPDFLLAALGTRHPSAGRAARPGLRV